MSRHYDVIVLGRSLGTLTTAALLARRDFRILVLGQGQKPAEYRFDGFPLRRRAFTMLAATSPVWQRVLQELAQTPRFRRHTRPLDPMFVVAGDRWRLEVPPDMELFHRELNRELTEVRQVVDELYATFGQVNAQVDDVLERDLVWPPNGFWQRMETGRAAAQLPLVSKGSVRPDLMGKFPTGHVYREIVHEPALFASNLATPGEALPPLAVARLHGAWTRGLQSLAGGEDELTQFLIERIEAHGGVCELDRRAESLCVRRGSVVGVSLPGEDEMLGADVVVSDDYGEMVAELAGGEGITKRARRDWPRLTATLGRFVVSIVAHTEGLPEPLPEEAFLIPPRQEGRHNPRRPVVHLQRFDYPASEEQKLPPHSLLVAEALLPTRGPLTLLEAREAVLTTVKQYLPFLDRHLIVVDSPHDGLPLVRWVDGRRQEIDRIHVKESLPGPEPMQWQWTVEPTGYLEVGGETVVGPIPGTYLVGPTVMPGLGQEGELLAAWGAARCITKRDRARQRMRRQMWTKIEMG